MNRLTKNKLLVAKQRIKQFLTKKVLVIPVWLIILCLLFLPWVIRSRYQTERLIESIAVSDDEQFIAYIQDGPGVLLICQKPNGETVFTYDLTEQSNGATYVWFENDTVCALIFRDKAVLRFSLQGELLNKVKNEENKEAFPGFEGFFNSHKTYSGECFTLEYDGATFIGFRMFDAERTLKAFFPNGDEVVLWHANAWG